MRHISSSHGTSTHVRNEICTHSMEITQCGNCFFIFLPDALAVVRPTKVYLLDFFCFGIQCYLLLSP